jgi:hypothetical protein
LKVSVLDSILVWSFELPTLRVAVPNEFRRRITFLSTHLTNLSHDILMPNWIGANRKDTTRLIRFARRSLLSEAKRSASGQF